MSVYTSFTLRIQQSNDSYSAIVNETPLNSTASADFDPPFQIDKIDSLLKTVGLGVYRGGQFVTKLPGSPSVSSTDLGHMLYESLFSGKVGDQFKQSVVTARERKQVLRIKLQMDVTNPLFRLPWELLYNRENQDYLNLSPYTTLVRSLDIESSNSVRPLEGPMRILFISANPKRDLKLDKEIAKIKKALLNEKGFIIEELNDVSYSSLQERLADTNPHVVHFMGHGSFDGEKGVLLFAQPHNPLQEDHVSGEDLGVLLRNELETRLVFLNACNTARSDSDEAKDPFSGVAASMIQAGMPAVVAMQFPITDDAAIAFSSRFYQDLAGGMPVEHAVASGRMAVKGKLRKKAEWATPVLFMQAGANKLFERHKEDDHTEEVEIEAASESEEAALTTDAIKDAIDISLQPYQVDRVRMLDELQLGILKQEVSPETPLICIIHGDTCQCQVHLHDRLCEVELPGRLNLNDLSESVQSFDLGWPKQYRTVSDFHTLLTSKLSLAVRKVAENDTGRIRDMFVEMPAVSVRSTVYSADWEGYPEQCIEDYIAYWANWPQARAQRLVIFLYVTYNKVEKENKGLLSSFFKKKETLTDSIEDYLESLNTLTFDGVFVQVLPRLGAVSFGDAEQWAAKHGHKDLIGDIKSIYDGREFIQMDALTEELKVLLDRKYPASAF